MRMKDKIVVVTGAHTGIGAASAKALAEEGAHVLAVDVDKGVEETVEEIKEAGNQASAFIVDISEQSEVETLSLIHI